MNYIQKIVSHYVVLVRKEAGDIWLIYILLIAVFAQYVCFSQGRFFDVDQLFLPLKARFS